MAVTVFIRAFPLAAVEGKEQAREKLIRLITDTPPYKYVDFTPDEFERVAEGHAQGHVGPTCGVVQRCDVLLGGLG